MYAYFQAIQICFTDQIHDIFEILIDLDANLREDYFLQQILLDTSVEGIGNDFSDFLVSPLLLVPNYNERIKHTII